METPNMYIFSKEKEHDLIRFKSSRFKESIKEGLYDICVLFYRCLYRESVVVCYDKKSGCKLNEIFSIKSFDNSFYICNTCNKKYLKGYIPCQAVSKVYIRGIRKLRVRGIRKFEKVLIAKRTLFMLLLK